ISGATAGSIFDRHYRYQTYGFYLQDDMRAASRLTVNLGLRYEFNTVPNEVDGLNSGVSDILTIVSPQPGGKALKQSSLKNWSPRLGFAWDVTGDGKMSVRGGTSLLYDIGWFNSNFVEQATGGPPFSTQSTVSAIAPATLPLLSLPLTFPASAVG